MNAVSGKVRFAILDPLRLIAALFVLIYHYSIYVEVNAHSQYFLNIAKYGYLGVVFFFMLSGFVISSSAEKSTPLKFAFARAKRLYPAFIACLGITLAVAYFCEGKVWPLKDILLNALILNDYFHIANVDGVYWTLQAELKFYGCVFILISLGLFRQHKYWLTIWLAAACLHFYTAQPFFMGWFINPSYSFYFIGGVVALLIHKNKRGLLLHIYFLLSLLFGVAMAGSQVNQFIDKVVWVDVYAARLIVLGFYIFFYMLAQGKLNINMPPWWFTYLGAVSYPLYLLHNRCGKTLIGFYQDSVSLFVLVPLVMLVIIAMSLMVHLIIEKPIAKLK